MHPDVFVDLEMSQRFGKDLSADGLYHNSIPLLVLFVLLYPNVITLDAQRIPALQPVILL